MQNNSIIQTSDTERNKGRQETGPAHQNVVPLFADQSSIFQSSARSHLKFQYSQERKKPLAGANDSWNEGSLNLRPSNKIAGLAEGFKKICQRWKLDNSAMAMLLHLEEEIVLSAQILSGQVPPLTGDLKDRMTIVIGISLGLGDLFGECREAEVLWLNSKHSKLDDLTPLEHMLKGAFTNLTDITQLLDSARGLR